MDAASTFPGLACPCKTATDTAQQVATRLCFKGPGPWWSPECSSRRGSEGCAMLAGHSRHQQPL